MGGNLSGIEITIFTERNGDIAEIERLNLVHFDSPVESFLNCPCGRPRG